MVPSFQLYLDRHNFPQKEHRLNQKVGKEKRKADELCIRLFFPVLLDILVVLHIGCMKNCQAPCKNLIVLEAFYFILTALFIIVKWKVLICKMREFVDNLVFDLV